MSTRARWGVPTGAVAVVGIVIGASAAASAAPPSLPARSVAQLLAEVQTGVSKPLGPLSATLQQTANLGLPSLPQVSGIGGDSGLLSTLAGTTSVSVWYLDPQHVRMARPVPMGENDLRLDGRQLWLWNSKTQTATHVLLPKQAGKGVPAARSIPPAMTDESPLAAARQALKLVGPSTTVTLGPNVTVAGRSAYQISISPKGSGSLVSKILIAIDASRHIPLQVQVFARSSSSPVYQLGYTALTFGRPAMSNFSFTPPAGAKVRTVTIPSRLPAGLGKLGPAGIAGLGAFGRATIGQTWISSTATGQAPTGFGTIPALRKMRAAFFAQLPKDLTPAQRAARIKRLETQLVRLRAAKAFQLRRAVHIPSGTVLPGKAALRQIIAHLPKNMPAAQRAAIIKRLRLALAGQAIAGLGANGGGFINVKTSPALSGHGRPTVLGQGWESVIATPANPAVWDAVERLLSNKPVITVPGSSAQPVPSGPGSASAQAVPGQPIFQQLGSGGSQVTYSFSSGSQPTIPGPLPVGPDLVVLRALLRVTTPVHGAWGSGRLLQTALLSVLITSKGQILAGAVTPSVLYADALSLSR
jgi:outer membrane lipoprotein-sorting protein